MTESSSRLPLPTLDERYPPCKIHPEAGRSTMAVRMCCMNELDHAVEAGDEKAMLEAAKNIARGQGWRFPGDADYEAAK
jgi:hypothetical protein